MAEYVYLKVRHGSELSWMDQLHHFSTITLKNTLSNLNCITITLR